MLPLINHTVCTSADGPPAVNVDLALGHGDGRVREPVLDLPQRHVLVVLGAGVGEHAVQELPGRCGWLLSGVVKFHYRAPHLQ